MTRLLAFLERRHHRITVIYARNHRPDTSGRSAVTTRQPDRSTTP